MRGPPDDLDARMNSHDWSAKCVIDVIEMDCCAVCGADPSMGWDLPYCTGEKKTKAHPDPALARPADLMGALADRPVPQSGAFIPGRSRRLPKRGIE
jgi:hypothetical protein